MGSGVAYGAFELYKQKKQHAHERYLQRTAIEATATENGLDRGLQRELARTLFVQVPVVVPSVETPLNGNLARVGIWAHPTLPTRDMTMPQ